MVLKVVGPIFLGGRKMFNPFANILVMEKVGTNFPLAKCVKNTCERVTFQIKVQEIDVYLNVKFHSSTGVSHTFC